MAKKKQKQRTKDSDVLQVYSGLVKKTKAVVKPKAKPSRAPTSVSDAVWYYEYRGRIEVIHQDPITRKYIHIHLPWKKLEESARRCRPELFV